MKNQIRRETKILVQKSQDEALLERIRIELTAMIFHFSEADKQTQFSSMQIFRSSSIEELE